MCSGSSGAGRDDQARPKGLVQERSGRGGDESTAVLPSSRSAGGDEHGQVMELLLFENRECSISREACGESARGCDVNTAVAQRTGILLHARRVACLV